MGDAQCPFLAAVCAASAYIVERWQLGKKYSKKCRNDLNHSSERKKTEISRQISEGLLKGK